MITPTHYHFAGLGQSQSAASSMSTAQQAQVAGTGTAAAAAQIIHGNYVGAAGTAIMTIGLYVPGPAAIFLEVAGAVAELLGAIGIGQGCGNTCIAATEFANQAEPLLRQNLNTYLGLPIPRYQSQQTAALNIFDQTWAALISPNACGNPALGSAGKACVSDRQRGSCAYTGSDGKCWNWFIGYRDPIANDPNVVPDTPASSVASAVSSVTGLNIDPTLLMIGLGVAVIVMVAL